MTNIIIVIILLAMVGFAANYVYKKKKSGAKCIGCPSGGCSSKPLPQKKLEGKKLGQKIVRIQGMTCAHCVESVTKAINEIEGASAKVELNKNRAVVSYDRPVSDEAIKTAVGTKGFLVTEITDSRK